MHINRNHYPRNKTTRSIAIFPRIYIYNMIIFKFILLARIFLRNKKHDKTTNCRVRDWHYCQPLP